MGRASAGKSSSALDEALFRLRELGTQCAALPFSEPVAYVYNPMDYAWAPFEQYVRRFARPSGQILLLGMNPGPWGMAQTGVPFGDVTMVRDWMGVEAPVAPPPREHPKYPVAGFECPRGEVSGQRLWGWARERYGTAERFFERFFVINYCPLCFIESGGRNRTPDKLPAEERTPVLAACDAAVRTVIERLEPSYVLGVGRFAEKRCRALLGDEGPPVASVPHPSPASPAANQGWYRLMDEALAALDLG